MHKSFILKIFFLTRRLLQFGKVSNWCYHLAGFVLLTIKACFTIRTSLINCDCVSFLTMLWGFLKFGAMSETLNCIGQSWISDYGWTPVSACLCLVYNFEVLSLLTDFFGGGQLDLHEKNCAYHFNFKKKKRITTLDYFEIFMFAEKRLKKWSRNHPNLCQKIHKKPGTHIRGLSHCHSHISYCIRKTPQPRYQRLGTQ